MGNFANDQHCMLIAVGRTQEAMVRGDAAPLRAMAAAALLQFLLDWPLAERRLARHLEGLVANLSYDGEAGREQVLTTSGLTTSGTI